MTATEAHGDDGNAHPGDAGGDDESSVVGHEECRETVDGDTRETVLERDRYRCQTCGRAGPQAGGIATLHVHHIDRDPDGLDVHDVANLTTLCRSCHNWHHQKTTEADAPVEITDADLNVLLPQDIEILRTLAEDGPAMTGEVVDSLSADLSVMAVRERLWLLMGLDNIVESRDQQIVDQDVGTGEWGLSGQIAASARGHIPEDPQEVVQRAKDERLRQALDRGCDRKVLQDVFDVSRRTTFYMQKRAHAYDFPLGAFDAKGGQPPTPDGPEKRSSTSSEVPDSEQEGQQRLDAVTGDVSESVDSDGDGVGKTSAEVSADARDDDESGVQSVDGGDTEAIQAHLQQAIDALQAVDSAL